MLMNNILLVYKEKGMTSFDVIRELRKCFKIKAIGHCGTLDPNAEGLLIVLLGKATKLSQFIIDDHKEYLAKVKLGIMTDSLDIDGKIIKEAKQEISLDDLKELLAKFKGRLIQKPPIISAIKIKGKKLYEYHRENKEIKIPDREVYVYHNELITYDKNEFSFKTKVSKGTYIRSLVRDMLEAKNKFGILSDLLRISQGPHNINKAYRLDDIRKGNFKLLDPLEFMKEYYHEYITNKPDDIYNGKKIKINSNHQRLIISYDNKLIAIYEKDGEYYRSLRGLF